MEAVGSLELDEQSRVDRSQIPSEDLQRIIVSIENALEPHQVLGWLTWKPCVPDSFAIAAANHASKTVSLHMAQCKQWIIALQRVLTALRRREWVVFAAEPLVNAIEKLVDAVGTLERITFNEEVIADPMGRGENLRSRPQLSGRMYGAIEEIQNLLTIAAAVDITVMDDVVQHPDSVNDEVLMTEEIAAGAVGNNPAAEIDGLNSSVEPEAEASESKRQVAPALYLMRESDTSAKDGDPLPDGPDISSSVFRWQGQTVEGFTPTGFDVLNAMWNLLDNPKHRILRADVATILPDRMSTWKYDRELKSFSKYQTEIRKAFETAGMPCPWEYDTRTKHYVKSAVYRRVDGR